MMSAIPSAVLRVDASGRYENSNSRLLADELIGRWHQQEPRMTLVRHDLAEGVPFVNCAWIEANFTPEEQRTEAQQTTLALSNHFVADLFAADTILIASPIYNFSVPASLKAWIDLVCRARKTFRYTENGPMGLLENKRAILIIASAGTELGSEIDFATPYLLHILKFIGVTDVEIVAADRLMFDGESKLQAARRKLNDLGGPAAGLSA